ncbi:MAG: hypothetical protein P4M09_31660 [Devosia sp.]|nr:hypothetical protein [Devosia sp.]
MNLEELEDALDEYGADFENWPADRARAAQYLLRESPDARALLAFQLSIESGLKAPATARAPTGLADRIVTQAMGAPGATPEAEVDLGKPGAARRRFIRRRSLSLAMRYAAVFAVCFGSGLAAAQTLNAQTNTKGTTYVSALYADLAW